MNRGQPQNFGRGFDATILQIRAGIELLEASYEHWRFWHQLFFVAKHWHLQQTFRKVLANIGAKGKEPATPSAFYDWAGFLSCGTQAPAGARSARSQLLLLLQLDTTIPTLRSPRTDTAWQPE